MMLNNVMKINTFKNISFLDRMINANKKKLILYVWVYFGVLPTIVFFATSLIEGSFSFSGLSLKDDNIFLSYFIFIPTYISLALIYIPNYPDILETLKNVIQVSDSGAVDTNAGATPISINRFNSLLIKIENMINPSGRIALIQFGLIIGGVLWAVMCALAHWNAVETYGIDIWSSNNYLLSFIVRTLYELVLFGFVLPILLYKYFSLLFSIRFLFRKLTDDNAIQLRPMSPDDAGGLGAFGKYSLKLVLVFLPFLLPILTYIASGFNTIPFLLGVSLYTPALVFVFFFPLSGAHDIMKRQKNCELKVILEMFNTAYDNMRESYSAGGERLAEYIGEVQDLRDVYEKTNYMPVWPFTAKTLKSFLAVIGATLVSIWMDWIVSTVF